MVWITSGSEGDNYTQHESYYQTKYNLWNGLVSRNPVLRQIIDIRAASVFSSWRVKGTHENQATTILNGIKGRNNESFKQIMANMYRVAYTCGDAYAEKIYDGDPGEGKIVNLEILPADNIRQVIEKGKIKNYEEVDTGKKFDKFRIFHIRYNPRGAMTHGIGMIESLNNTLISREQLMVIGQEIYERMSRPRELILAKTDNKDKLDMIRDAIKDAGDTWSGIAVLPHTLIEDIKDIQLSVSLKPQEYIDFLDKDVFKATATPEIILGTGYSTSEEDAKTRIAGFMGSIRYDQEMFEEDVRQQIFMEMWPTNPPEIEFSFTQESYDAMYTRVLDTIPIIEAAQTIAPQNKEIMVKEKLKEAGMIT